MAHENEYVRLENINKTFGDYKASRDIDFEIAKGKLVALLGPSGSGKTTILKMLAGLETPDSGNIYIDGKIVNNVKASDRGIGFVFQNYALFRYKNVYDNIAFGLKIKKADKAYINKKVTELIRLVGLKGLEKRYPRQLSGGQRQGVAFARALAVQPQLLLLDEPFAAIDAKVRKELRSWLRDLINEVGITSIFVTHDQEEAVEIADEIIVTNHGRIEQIGTPIELYENPATPFVAEFLGENSSIDDYGKFKGFENEAAGSHAIIRPEYVVVNKKNEQIKYAASVQEGIVERVTFAGNAIELKIDILGQKLKAYRRIGQQLIEPGERVDVLISRMFMVDGERIRKVENQLFTSQNSIFI